MDATVPPTTCRSASSGTRTARRPGNPTTPSCSACVDADPRRLPAPPRRVRRPGLGLRLHARRETVAVLPPADRAVSRRRDRGRPIPSRSGKAATSSLSTTYKSPDYTGHVYGMGSKWTGLQLRAVDEELGRLRSMLDERFPDEYALIVTADHGQCPLPDSVGGVRLDLIQLERFVESRFSGVTGVVESVVPSEAFLNVDRLRDNGGATIEDVAPRSPTTDTGRTSAPTCRATPSSRTCSTRRSSQPSSARRRRSSPRRSRLARYGDTVYADGDPDGIPGPGPVHADHYAARDPLGQVRASAPTVLWDRRVPGARRSRAA